MPGCSQEGVALAGNDLEMRAALMRLDGMGIGLLSLEKLQESRVSRVDQHENSWTHVLQYLDPADTLGFFRIRHTVTDGYKLSIDVFQARGDGTCKGLLDLLLDEASSERLKCIVKEVVLGVPDGELECVDLHMDALDLKDRRFVLVCRDEVDGRLCDHNMSLIP